ESPSTGSVFGLGKLRGVYGPLEDGFFLQLDQPDFSPDPVYMFGWHILNAPPVAAGFLYPRGPSAGARDPRVGGLIVGAPGRGFPCDQTPEDEGTPHDCTAMPDGIYLREFGPDSAPPFPALRLFDPPGADGRVAVGMDVNGRALVLAIAADGSTVGRWVDPDGTAGQPQTFGALPSGPVTDAVLAPLARGGLAYRRNGDWVRIFDPAEGDSPPPCWLAGLSGFDLRIAANTNGYAAIPTEAVGRHCDRAIDVYTLDGTACGSVALGTSDESCTGHVTLGPQGSVLRLLQGPPFEGGHPSCELRTWPGLLGPSP
ncbi:MAG TPA: hypothetical protein VFN91_08285, partial [Myxococcaceae bacterium]|nr:hypothetical protein [Myxococcaceae bacterium]